VEYGNSDLYHDYSTTYSYTSSGELRSLCHYVNYLSQGSLTSCSFDRYMTYDADGKLTGTSFYANDTRGGETFFYDEYERAYKKVNSFYLYSDSSKTFENEINYTFYEHNDKTSSLVSSYSSTVEGGYSLYYDYTYDKNGNIIKIADQYGDEIRYVYDDLGQLLREDNEFLGETYVYTYDNAGNIMTKKTYFLTAEGETPTLIKKTLSYGYSTSEWGDLLISYGEDEPGSITYDDIGNPLSYYNGYTFTWTGRRLTGATVGDDTYTFVYNDEGIRTSKTKNGVTTTYYLNGSQIIAEETSGNVTVYIYDSTGLPLGMQYHAADYATGTWDRYWYEKNLQGDIVAVYSESGEKLVSYTYDAWGNVDEFYYDNSELTTVVNNPFRYRGYYYDKDLGLYYLNSRYYDSNTGRFISADGVGYLGANGDLNSYNLYAYCSNNPVMGIDPTGKWAISRGVSFFAVCFGGLSYSLAFSLDDDWNFGIQITEANVLKKKSGVMIGGINAGVNAKFSISKDADTIYDLEGEGFSASASLSNYGIEASTSDLNNIVDGVNVFSLSYGPSLMTVDVSATASKTKTIWSFNIAKTIKKAWKGLVSIFE